MKTNDFIDLIQYNEYTYNATHGINEEIPTYVAKNVPCYFSSLRLDQKLLQNQDVNWLKRFIVQHKIIELQGITVDAVYRHSTGETLDVYWNNGTGAKQTVSYRVETKDIRREAFEGDIPLFE